MCVFLILRGSGWSRYETQTDLLRLLKEVGRHYAAAALSLKVTRSFDAARILTMASMTAVADAVLRAVAHDIPSQLSLHYSGRAFGPVKPFGVDVGFLGAESEFLQFSSPELCTVRTQVRVAGGGKRCLCLEETFEQACGLYCL